MAEVLALLDRGAGLGHRPYALLGVPVELDQHAVAGCVDELVGLHSEALLVAVVGGDAPRVEEVGEQVHRLRCVAHEVEDALGLLSEGDRVRLQGVDDVGERDGVTDEEHRDVVADDVPVAVLGVELHREAPGVTGGLRGVTAADDGGEAQGDVGALARLLEQLGPGVLRRRVVADLAVCLEVAERRGPWRVVRTLSPCRRSAGWPRRHVILLRRPITLTPIWRRSRPSTVQLSVIGRSARSRPCPARSPATQ